MVEDRSTAERWLAGNVRQRREALGLSQSQLAAAMSERGQRWTQNTVYKVEAATRVVSALEVIALAQVFTTSVPELAAQPHTARRRWALEAMVTRLEDAYGGLYDVVWELTAARVELAGALAHARPDDDADVIEDATASLADHTVEAVVAEVVDQRAADQAERLAADAARQAREDAEAARLAGSEG